MVINNNSSRDSIFGLFLTLCLVGLSIFFTSIKEIDKTIFVVEKGMSLNAVTNLLHEKDSIEFIFLDCLIRYLLGHFQ